MNVVEFLILVMPALVVGVMALSVFAMTIHRYPFVGILALANVIAEIAVALSWMSLMPYWHWLDGFIDILCLLAPFFLLFGGLLLLRSKDVWQRKCLLTLSFGGFGLSVVHTVFWLITATMLARIP